MIWTILWHLNSLFAEVAMDVSYKNYITLGLLGDEGWDFTIQLECIKKVSSVDVSAKIEVAFCYVDVNCPWQVFPASFI